MKRDPKLPLQDCWINPEKHCTNNCSAYEEGSSEPCRVLAALESFVKNLRVLAGRKPTLEVPKA